MKQGFLQALGVTVYISLVGLFMANANAIFPKMGAFLGPVALLLLFSTSVLICGLIVFYKPYKLFLAGKKKEALGVVIRTAAFLFMFLLLFFLGLALFK